MSSSDALPIEQGTPSDSSGNTSAQRIRPIVLSTSKTAQKTPAETFPASEHQKGNSSWHTLLSAGTTSSNTFSIGTISVPPKNGTLALHRHSHPEFYFVLSGRAVVRIEGQDYDVKAEDLVFIPGDAEHGVFNNGDEEFRWLWCFGADRFEDVVYRFTGQQK